VVGIDAVPPSLYWDEVSQGYNAYSILKTGHDEHNEFLPLIRFQAFGDYKAPVYIYLDVLSIALFGQTEFAVRLPSALLGSLTVLTVYFLSRELLIDNKRKNGIALAASFFLAISPWHIQLSRAAYEANIATFFTVLGVYFFLKARQNIYVLLPSVVSLVLAFYSFNAHRIFIPLMVLLMGLLFYKDFIPKLKQTVLIGFFGLLLLIPFLFYLRTPESRLRFNEVNIFSDISRIELSNKLIESDGQSLFSRVIHNRRVLYALSYIENYLTFKILHTFFSRVIKILDFRRNTRVNFTFLCCPLYSLVFTRFSKFRENLSIFYLDGSC
jgi:4-amino-4-deoxy-L-arabinose transferase-like glycosyltransferase